MLSQGKEWEKKAEYNRAIDMYLKITPNMTTDHELVEDAMVKVRGACHGVLPSSACTNPHCRWFMQMSMQCQWGCSKMKILEIEEFSIECAK